MTNLRMIYKDSDQFDDLLKKKKTIILYKILMEIS